MIRIVSWSPFKHVALVFKGPLPSEKNGGFYRNKIRIFQSINSYRKTDVNGIEMEKDGVNLYHFDKYLEKQRSFGAKAYVLPLTLNCSSEEKKLLDEKIGMAINNHIDDKYGMWGKHRWICSTIIAKIFKEVGIFKSNTNIYTFFPGTYVKLDEKDCLVKGMNFGIKQKMISY